jgi:oligoribonuclease (3'-5' exoribonuclease)
MYLWIDLETTGLDPDYDRMIEVGWFLSDTTNK